MRNRIINYWSLLTVFIIISCSDQNSDSTETDSIGEWDSLSTYVTFDDLDVGYNENKVWKDSQGHKTSQDHKTSFDTITIDNKIYYIVEGDLLLDVNELKVHFNRKNRPYDNRKLSGIIRDGQILKIENPTNITYSIIKATFSDKEYKDVMEYMHEAATNWGNVCNVNFVHNSELDNELDATDNPDNVTFVVRKIGRSSGGLLASAFYPYDPKSKRKVLITPSFFRTSFKKSGILTHELGHILGFRHEHIRSAAPAVCPKDSPISTIDLTLYDPQSVMHYFCGGTGSRDLKITELDSIGASLIYK